MDFSQLGRSRKKAVPTDPIRIFESLPSLVDTPNDLWRGQDKALSDWQDVRDRHDVLISLNTGAGKTIVGLLIAQSLVNDGTENVLYVCSTIDLVLQTAREADRIGIDYTIRIRGDFSNDLFETGKAFCITTYAALFNGYSIFAARFFPHAIIFDDAHVAEGLLRGAFTLRITQWDHKELFADISELFRPHFGELGIPGQFQDSLDSTRLSTAFVAPHGLYQRHQRLLDIFRKHNIKDTNSFKFTYAWLEDHINACAAIFSRGVFELSPPFLPSLALNYFDRPIKRIYLSATLESLADFIRAFGRKPDAIVTPANDAGNGERLVIGNANIKGGFGPEFARALIAAHKTVIAVPSYLGADAWKEIAEPPATEDFSDALEEFRKGSDGIFLLVSRVDGIDLPHDTCRIMIIDGIPSGSSLIERFQWQVLAMNNFHAVRVANRLAQLFGRINRGRNDYGAFLMQGNDINKWISHDRNLALLPKLLQQQILIGREIQHGFGIADGRSVIDVINRVIARDDGWLNYYQDEVKLAKLDEEQVERHRVAEPFLVEAALSESKYAAAMWVGDASAARRHLERTADETTKHDTPLGGWHALWLGAAYDLEGDQDAASIAYGNAMKRLGRSLILPRPQGGRVVRDNAADLNSFGRALDSIVSYTHGNKYEAELEKLCATLSLIEDGTPRQAEVGVRELGERLGYTATRPDNDLNTGPDVLWRDEANLQLVGFELKTDKHDPATYFKKDISQGHDHLQWMADIYGGYDSFGVIYVGPDGVVDRQANPSDKMGLCPVGRLVDLRTRLVALIEDLRNETPLQRVPTIAGVSTADEWQMDVIVGILWQRKLAEKPTV